MTIRKIGPTTWECEYADGEYNSTYTIEATGDGLEIDYHSLPWDEIDAARLALNPGPEKKED